MPQTDPANAIASLTAASPDELAILVPEYLLAGHLIDRAGMPQVIASLGTDAMRDVAIDEWMAASPVYTKRMQRALGFEGDTVATIFKGMQLDVGAPPQFMDFRYALTDDTHGEFWLDHCGALMDVEPMGEDYVRTMCHDIEDPTFDATAAATNPRAQVRPVHRPPRVPADRSPHCHWTVTIVDDADPLPMPEGAIRMGATEAARLELSAIDASEPGQTDYAGPLVSDLRFTDWAPSALLRIADEVCLQGHLLTLAFVDAVRARLPDAQQATELARKQFTGVAGIAARRLKAALQLGDDLRDAATVLALHPALQPHAYTQATVELDDRLLVRLPRDTPAVRDGSWLALLDPAHLEPLDAIVREVDPRFRCDPVDEADGLVLEVVMDDVAAKTADDVVLTAFSTGADFRFTAGPTPVEIRPRPTA